jgi:hypothetical protein
MGFTVKFDGKDYPATGTMPGGADSISIKNVDANHYEATLGKAGKVSRQIQTRNFQRRQRATLTSKGVAADGKPQHAVPVYDKQ